MATPAKPASAATFADFSGNRSRAARRYRERVRFQFRPMTQEDAEAVAGWHYPEPFSFYDWQTDELPELLDPRLRADDLVAVDYDSGNLVGFFHCKPPHHPSLEIGLGMHPDWTGRGLGQSFVEAGLEYARRRYAPEEFLLSVATFNRRAITVYERVGFVRRRTYTHWTLGRDWEFIEMSCPAERIAVEEDAG